MAPMKQDETKSLSYEMLVEQDRLNELIRKALAGPPMTPDEIREQKISFAYGQLMDCAPHITKDEIREELRKMGS